MLDHMNALEGSTLNGRYRVENALGVGGMATVYCGYDQDLNRRVALKILHRHYAVDDSFVARLRREAELAARVSPHPNIVGVYDIRHDGLLHYIVMEIISGQTLKELIQQQAPISFLETARVGRQACLGLGYAHDRDVIHRDIKPQNVLLDDQGNVKLTDFGIAVARASSRLTLPGIVLGSLQYMSPEQALGKPVTASSDIYSLGLVLFEMLTGRLPFEGNEASDIRARYAREALPSPRDINSFVPEEVADAVMVALRKDPAARYPNAQAFAESLERFERGTRRATVSSTPKDVVDFPSRRLARASFMLVLAIGVLVVAWISFESLRTNRNSPGAAAGPTAVTTPRATSSASSTLVPRSTAAPSLLRASRPAPSTPGIAASVPVSHSGAISVSPLAGAVPPAVQIAGTRFQPREMLVVQISWHTTSSTPGPGYRWYQIAANLRTQSDGSFNGALALPVSPQSFASSEAYVSVRDARTEQSLGQTSVHIVLAPPAAVPVGPPQEGPRPGNGHDREHGKGHGGEQDNGGD